MQDQCSWMICILRHEFWTKSGGSLLGDGPSWLPSLDFSNSQLSALAPSFETHNDMQGFAMGISPALYLVRELKLHCFGALHLQYILKDNIYIYQYNICVYVTCMYLHVFLLAYPGDELLLDVKMVIFVTSQFQVACIVVTVSPSLGRGSPGEPLSKLTNQISECFIWENTSSSGPSGPSGPRSWENSTLPWLPFVQARRSQRGDGCVGWVNESRLPRKESNQSPPSECCNGSKKPFPIKENKTCLNSTLMGKWFEMCCFLCLVFPLTTCY